ncbi:MAG: protein kinase [Thermoanaerobaculia bacterium]
MRTSAVYDIDQTEGRLFIAMAFYRGETLEERLGRGPLPLGESLHIVGEVLRGLAAAHDKHIVHRDIKPANIMLTDDGRVKILDFGVAKLKDQRGLTETGATVGTVAYISPEQLEGESVDRRTDLWSVGVVLYELVAGRHPFDASNAGAMMNAILHREAPAPSSLAKDLPEGFDVLLARALAKERDDRFSSAEQFHRALPTAGMDTDLTLAALPSAATLRISRRPRRLLPWLLATGAATLLATVLLLLVRPHGATSDRPYTIAVLPFSNLTGSATQQYLAEGISSSLITQLSELVGLRVLSRSETWSLADEGLTARELSTKLGIDSLLEGQLQQQGERLLASITLTDGATGSVIWSDRLESSPGEVFGLQTSIARRLARALEIQLSPVERRRLAQDPTRSAQASDDYLRGRELLEDATDDGGLHSAIEMLRRAVDLDPGFALAHTGLSEALWRSWVVTLDESQLAAAQASVERALELDPDLPAAIVARARIMRSTGRQQRSIEELQRVLSRHPTPAEAYQELAESYELAGRTAEAEEAWRMAVSLDEGDWNAWSGLGRLLVQLGEMDEAASALRRARDLAPERITGPSVDLATFALQTGDMEEAIRRFEALPKPIREARVASNLGFAYYFSERPDRLEKAVVYFEQAVELRPAGAGFHRNLADTYAALDRIDEARAEYRRAYELVTQQLAENPTDVESQTVRIEYAAKADDCDLALSLAAERREAPLDRASDVHRLGIAYALCGDREQALASIRRAVELQFPVDVIRQEAELESLHALPEFQKLVATAPSG